MAYETGNRSFVWNVRQKFLQIERVESEFFVGKKLKGVYSCLCLLVLKRYRITLMVMLSTLHGTHAGSTARC